VKALIATPFADSRATDLSLSYGLPPLPALSTHQVELPGARVELRVLGASHQVVLDVGRPEQVAGWSETVACLPDRQGNLPAHDMIDSGPLRIRFRAGCLRLNRVRLAEQVQVIARRCEGHPRALVGTFPGSPFAITALLVQDRGAGEVGWYSWHAYPQTAELVTTASVVVMAR
jgi:hypothetical protein